MGFNGEAIEKMLHKFRKGWCIAGWAGAATSETWAVVKVPRRKGPLTTAKGGLS